MDPARQLVGIFLPLKLCGGAAGPTVRVSPSVLHCFPPLGFYAVFECERCTAVCITQQEDEYDNLLTKLNLISLESKSKTRPMSHSHNMGLNVCLLYNVLSKKKKKN